MGGMIHDIVSHLFRIWNISLRETITLSYILTKSSQMYNYPDNVSEILITDHKKWIVFIDCCNTVMEKIICSSNFRAHLFLLMQSWGSARPPMIWSRGFNKKEVVVRKEKLKSGKELSQLWPPGWLNFPGTLICPLMTPCLPLNLFSSIGLH